MMMNIKPLFKQSFRLSSQYLNRIYSNVNNNIHPFIFKAQNYMSSTNKNKHVIDKPKGRPKMKGSSSSSSLSSSSMSENVNEDDISEHNVNLSEDKPIESQGKSVRNDGNSNNQSHHSVKAERTSGDDDLAKVVKGIGEDHPLKSAKASGDRSSKSAMNDGLMDQPAKLARTGGPYLSPDVTPVIEKKLTKRVIYHESTNKLEEINLFKENIPQAETPQEVLPSQSTIKKERLSKRLSRLGVSSRRQAEKLITTGMIQVNNKVVKENVLVTEDDKIKIFTKEGERTPLKQDTKLWVFNKPKGLICTHDDPQGRPTVFEFLRFRQFPSPHIISIGRLDYNSEGLLLLTNDGEVSRAFELPESQLERMYRVRVYGTFDETKLQLIRKGAVINGIKYGPYWAEVENKQTSNTWLRIKLSTGKNREIRRIMQKFSLRVNRLQRVKYGPYALGGLPSGSFVEVEITPTIKKMLYKQLVKKMKEVNYELEEKKQQEKLKLSSNASTDGRLRIKGKDKGSKVTLEQKLHTMKLITSDV